MYALYNGDKFIDLGTVSYLADLIKVSEKTIRFYASPTYKKRTKCNGWVVIKIEEDKKV